MGVSSTAITFRIGLIFFNFSITYRINIKNKFFFLKKYSSESCEKFSFAKMVQKWLFFNVLFCYLYCKEYQRDLSYHNKDIERIAVSFVTSTRFISREADLRHISANKKHNWHNQRSKSFVSSQKRNIAYKLGDLKCPILTCIDKKRVESNL